MKLSKSVGKFYKIPGNFNSTHPGEVLRDALEEIGISESQLAAQIGVSPKTVSEICEGKRDISAKMSSKLSEFIGASPAFWENLQDNYNIYKANNISFETIISDKDFKSKWRLKSFIEKGKNEVWGRIEDSQFLITTVGKTNDEVLENLKALILDYIKNEGQTDKRWKSTDEVNISFTYEEIKT